MHGEHDHVDTSLNEGAADDLLGLCWSVSGEFTAAFDGVDDVHAFADSTKDGVVAVEPGRGHGGQEELGAAGVATSVGHREHAGLVVLEGESRWLARDLPARTSGTGSARHRVLGMRAAALNHEIFNDAVEVETVVVTHFDELDEIGHRVGSTAVEEVDGDVACAGFHENLHDHTTERHLKRICMA